MTSPAGDGSDPKDLSCKQQETIIQTLESLGKLLVRDPVDLEKVYLRLLFRHRAEYAPLNELGEDCDETMESFVNEHSKLEGWMKRRDT